MVKNLQVAEVKGAASYISAFSKCIRNEEIYGTEMHFHATVTSGTFHVLIYLISYGKSVCNCTLAHHKRGSCNLCQVLTKYLIGNLTKHAGIANGIERSIGTWY